ncbi:MAG TPA: succinylglutamate desuccinylase/aspartoacylase family protein [Saprospiraceae bacterium]|nr:succinylglutamate desuccinylase/aspartoacylase family protein [Saprospiraceae bacterium]HMP14980.1 succinylglutamate desuccinylase/aspartoacylase family protein [Saprospiraceae bacterium]
MTHIHHSFATHIHHLDIASMPKGRVSEHWLHIINNGIGEPVRIPIVVARGAHEGPVLGITAAVHGNELNGIPVIQRLFREINVEELHGTVVGVLVINVPGLLLEQRKFNDGVDLNRIAPGKADGDVSQLYINRVVERILKNFNYLIDLHTASFGRVNSWYIRANMSIPITERMARLQNPEIILHNPPGDGTFRGTASSLGIRSITLELKDPHKFQTDIIEEALVGIRNVLYDFKMLPGVVVCQVSPTILCDRSYWIHSDEGGILEVYPKVKSLLKKGDLIAEVRTIFGQVVQQYFAPEDGIVIGKSVNPINQTGSRILHLGLNPHEIPSISEDCR